MAILISALTLFILGPILTFIHEFAHVLPVLVLTPKSATVIIGPKKRKSLTFRIKRLTVIINSYHPFYGKCSIPNTVSLKIRLVAFACGPIASLILTLISFYSLKHIENYVISYIISTIFWIEFSAFFRTALPLEYKFGIYKNGTSDGKQIINLLREHKKNLSI